jgi:hypothetical protein
VAGDGATEPLAEQDRASRGRSRAVSPVVRGPRLGFAAPRWHIPGQCPHLFYRRRTRRSRRGDPCRDRRRPLCPVALGQALADHVRLIVWCKRCNHRAEADIATQSRNTVPMPVRDWARLLRCTECGERDADFLGERRSPFCGIRLLCCCCAGLRLNSGCSICVSNGKLSRTFNQFAR